MLMVVILNSHVFVSLSAFVYFEPLFRNLFYIETILKCTINLLRILNYTKNQNNRY